MPVVSRMPLSGVDVDEDGGGPAEAGMLLKPSLLLETFCDVSGWSWLLGVVAGDGVRLTMRLPRVVAELREAQSAGDRRNREPRA